MLTKQKITFCEAYLETGNGAEAARRAGYSEKTARTQASRLLTSVDVQEYLRGRAEPIITSDEVLKRLTAHARGTMADFVRISQRGEPAINLRNAQALDQLHLIKKLRTTRKVSESGVELSVEIELYDAQAALVQLGKYYRLFTDRLNIDWSGELEALGLDPDAVESDLVENFRQHIAGGLARTTGA